MKLNKILFFAAVLTAGAYLSATPSFSGAIGGSAGGDLNVPLNGDKAQGTIPLAAYAAAQANITDWAIARGEIAAWASNLAFNDIFADSDANVRLNELSFVLQRRAFTATNYFSVFLGAYEPIGSDAFLMRHFGVEPISSRLTKSYTSLVGSPLNDTKGAGLSYVVNFDKAPIATGVSFYFSKNKDNDWAINLDGRFALATNLVTLDFVFGVGSPLQDTYKNQDVVLVIDTITLHGGINFLAGSKYTHGLLIQAGLEDVVVKGNNGSGFNGDEIRFLFAPRLKFNTFSFTLTAYSFSEKSVKELAYLRDPIGAGFTFYKDDIEGKRGDICLGIHSVFSVKGITFGDIAQAKDLSKAIYNAYVTPYAEIPLSGIASIETIAQIGVLDITGSPSLNFSLTIGAKRVF
jgi:hypothetical protein